MRRQKRNPKDAVVERDRNLDNAVDQLIEELVKLGISRARLQEQRGEINKMVGTPKMKSVFYTMGSKKPRRKGE